jgi:hypothetical protein
VNRIAALGKPTLVLAGLLLLVGTVLNTFVMPSKFSEAALTPLFEVSAALVLASSMLLVLSLVALHARQAEESGRFGLVAGLVALVGTMLFSGVSWSQTFLDPAAAKVVPAFVDDTPPTVLVVGFFGTLVVFGLGWMVYAIATLRAGVYPRLPVVVLLIGSFLAAVPFLPIGGTGIAIALIWLGLAPSRQPVAQLVPAA